MSSHLSDVQKHRDWREVETNEWKKQEEEENKTNYNFKITSPELLKHHNTSQRSKKWTACYFCTMLQGVLLKYVFLLTFKGSWQLRSTLKRGWKCFTVDLAHCCFIHWRITDLLLTLKIPRLLNSRPHSLPFCRNTWLSTSFPKRYAKHTGKQSGIASKLSSPSCKAAELWLSSFTAVVLQSALLI